MPTHPLLRPPPPPPPPCNRQHAHHHHITVGTQAGVTFLPPPPCNRQHAHHHLTVGTPADFTSAPKGLTYFAYMPQYLINSFREVSVDTVVGYHTTVWGDSEENAKGGRGHGGRVTSVGIGVWS